MKSLCPSAICCLNPIVASLCVCLLHLFIHSTIFVCYASIISHVFFSEYIFSVIVKTASSSSSTSGSVKKSKGGFLRSLFCCLGRRYSSDQGTKSSNNGNTNISMVSQRLKLLLFADFLIVHDSRR